MARIYENFILGNKYTSVLETKLNIQNFVTVDDSLTEEAGMIKKINTRTGTGSVADLGMGEGNTTDIDVTVTTVPYTVITTQGRFTYYDEEEMADDQLVDTGLTVISEKMVNDFTDKAVAEWKKTTNTISYTADDGIKFDDVVDALSKLAFEDETQLFMLIGTDTLGDLRKNLNDDLKYVESFVKTGYIGSVCGVPVYVTKALNGSKTAIISTKEAVTLFIKKDTEIEQNREPNIRKNEVYARKVSVVALTDATKCVTLIGA